jgi:acyl-CoA reductase-like NAD-dependent aldehyde dehydrogenase
MSAPQPIPQASVERYGDGVLVHWPDGTTAQYIETGNCVTAAPQPQPVGEWVMVPRERIQHACDLLAERTYGSKARSPGHNARLVLEAMLAAAPQPQAAAEFAPRIDEGSKSAAPQASAEDVRRMCAAMDFYAEQEGRLYGEQTIAAKERIRADCERMGVVK